MNAVHFPAGNTRRITDRNRRFSYIKATQTARLVLRNFQAGNARRKLLAFLRFVRIKTMQNGKVDFE